MQCQLASSLAGRHAAALFSNLWASLQWISKCKHSHRCFKPVPSMKAASVLKWMEFTMLLSWLNIYHLSEWVFPRHKDTGKEEGIWSSESGFPKLRPNYLRLNQQAKYTFSSEVNSSKWRMLFSGKCKEVPIFLNHFQYCEWNLKQTNKQTQLNSARAKNLHIFLAFVQNYLKLLCVIKHPWPSYFLVLVICSYKMYFIHLRGLPG